VELEVAQEVAVADDENAGTTASNNCLYSKQDPKRTQTTSKRFEEVKSRAHTRNFRGLFD
jgi:hypothetical protein